MCASNTPTRPKISHVGSPSRPHPAPGAVYQPPMPTPNPPAHPHPRRAVQAPKYGPKKRKGRAIRIPHNHEARVPPARRPNAPAVSQGRGAATRPPWCAPDAPKSIFGGNAVAVYSAAGHDMTPHAKATAPTGPVVVVQTGPHPPRPVPVPCRRNGSQNSNWKPACRGHEAQFFFVVLVTRGK